jgi:multiple sugar transport system ATP-binding protein
MNAGVVQQVGTPQEVYDRPANSFVASFVGTPTVNLLPVLTSADGGLLRLSLAKGGHQLNEIALPASPEVRRLLGSTQGRAILGVRPEAIALETDPMKGGISSVIDFVEPMGSVNHIVLALDGRDDITVDGEPFIAVVRSNEGFVHGQPVFVAFRPDRLALFHEESGHAIAVLSPERHWQTMP